jgi:adiponectin receptor
VCEAGLLGFLLRPDLFMAEEQNIKLTLRTKVPKALEDEICSHRISITKKPTDFKQKRLYCFHECPAYLQDNDCILTGYRAYYSYAESWLSLFPTHNESGNVWSHLCGFVVFFVMSFQVWMHPVHPSMETEDKLVLTIFLALACYTMFFSSMFHLHMCVSKHAMKFWACLDYSGISASIAGGSIAVMYLLLHCDGPVRVAWLSLLGIANLVGIVGPMFPNWNGPDFRKQRAMIYLASGASSFGPAFYYFYKYGTQHIPHHHENPAFTYLVYMAIQYVLGALVYSSRFPECFFPGKFDYIGHSHQLWHVLVVTATMTLYRALSGLIIWRLENESMCIP